jgi:hypothetical protein
METRAEVFAVAHAMLTALKQPATIGREVGIAC